MTSDCFVTQFDVNNQLGYSTYFGGLGAEYGGGISLYHNRIYICGGAGSISDFPLYDAYPSSSLDYFQQYSTIPGSTNSTTTDAFFAQLETTNNVIISIRQPTVSHAIDGLTVFPNPTNTFVSVRWSAPKPGKYQYLVSDLLGKQLAEGMGTGDAGINEIDINLGGIDAGIYLVNFIIEGRMTTKKIIVSK